MRHRFLLSLRTCDPRPRFVALAALGGWALAATSASAAIPTGVSDDRVVLPDGPGSVGGIGENVTLGGNMGLMSYRVPIRVPDGFAGMTPDLALTYSSGAGNASLGIGWTLATPSIERMTSRGLPRYGLDDTFAADGSDQLVKTGTDGGALVYRARFEGTFVRYEWHGAGAGAEGYWTAAYPDGRVAYFGAKADGTTVAAARVSDPTTGATFRYELVEIVDPWGHAIRYTWTKDASGWPMLDSIGWAHQADQTPRFAVRAVWEERSDVLSNATPGFEIQLEKRLAELRVVSGSEVIRRYALSYESDATSGGMSRLAQVKELGRGDVPYPIAPKFSYSRALGGTCTTDCDKPFVVDMGTLAGGVDISTGHATLVDMNGDGLPDVVASTSAGAHTIYLAKLSTSGQPTFVGTGTPSAAAKTGSPFVLGAIGVQVLDVNGDGLTDIVAGGVPAVLCNDGSGDWNGDACLANAALPLLDASQPGDNPEGVRFFDWDNDKRIDMLQTTASGAVVYANDGEQFSATNVDSIGAVFDQDNLDLSDMNGDGLQDPVQILTGGQLRYRLNLGFGHWGPWRTVSLPAVDPTQLLSADIEDIDGDGLSDVVIVLGNELLYSRNRNADHFDPFVSVTTANITGDLPVRDAATTVVYADMNGNGTRDVVWITSGGDVKFLELFPLRPNLLARIENGIGWVQTISYGTSIAERARDEAGAPWTHPLGESMNLVVATDSWVTLTGGEDGAGLHEVETFAYHDGFYDGAEKAFRGYSTVERTLEADPASDGQQPGRELSTWDVGTSDPYRAGLLLSEARFGGEALADPIRETRTEWGDCTVAGVPASGLAFPVRWSCAKAQVRIDQEGAATSSWSTSRIESDWDGYGNEVERRELGVSSMGSPESPAACGACTHASGFYGAPCGATCAGDERITHTDWITPGGATGGAWLARLPVKRTVVAAAGAEASETQWFYDGDAYVGLAAGQATKGGLTRRLERTTGSSLAAVERLARDANGNVVGSLDALGSPSDTSTHARSYDYDSLGLRVTREAIATKDASKAAYTLTREFTYDQAWLLPSEATDWMTQKSGTSSPRNSTRWRYDEQGRVAAVLRPGDTDAAPTESYRYELAAPASRIVVTRRSAVGGSADLEEVHCLDGRGRTYQKRTLVGSDAFLVSGFTAFNKRGQPVAVYQPYDGTTDACDTSAPQGVRFDSYAYDSLDRLIAITHPDAATFGTASMTTRQYLPLAIVESDEDDNDPKSPSAGTPTVTSFDGLGRVVAIERLTSASGGLRHTYEYDARGYLASVVDPGGHVKQQEHDLRGRVTRVDDPNAGTTLYTWDDAGNLVGTKDAAGVERKSSFDGVNRRVEEWDAADRAGTRLTWAWDADASCSACTNAAGRIVGGTWPGVGGSADAEQVGYDARGHRAYLARTLEGVSFETRFEHDAVGRLTKASYPDAQVVQWTWDGASRASSLPGVVDALKYEDRGQLTEIDWANGAIGERTYDDRMRLGSLGLAARDGTKLVASGYTRNRLGQLDEIADGADDRAGRPDRAAKYGYDALSRLTSAVVGAGADAETLAYGYDEIDALTSRTSSAGASSPAHLGAITYGAHGAGPAAATQAGSVSFGYDAAGRMTTRGPESLAWDFRGRLAGAKASGVADATYVYAPSGERVMKLESGGAVYYPAPGFEVRDGVSSVRPKVGSEVVARLRSTALATKVLSDLGPDAPDGSITIADAWLAEAASEGLTTISGEASDTTRLLRASARHALFEAAEPVTYLHADERHTPIVATDGDGALVSEAAFYPHGQPMASSGFVDDLGFSGEESDADGLSYFRERYLDPALGRWTSVDPYYLDVRLDRLDAREVTAAYAYVENDPVNRVDPTGLFTPRLGHKIFPNRKARRIIKERTGVSSGGSGAAPVAIGISIGAAFAIGGGVGGYFAFAKQDDTHKGNQSNQGDKPASPFTAPAPSPNPGGK